jgi:hypothetical protein
VYAAFGERSPTIPQQRIGLGWDLGFVVTNVNDDSSSHFGGATVATCSIRV